MILLDVGASGIEILPAVDGRVHVTVFDSCDAVAGRFEIDGRLVGYDSDGGDPAAYTRYVWGQREKGSIEAVYLRAGPLADA